ncbi:MBL fold metallo-hydrolase [Mesorhizobium sp. M0145]|uniref:MBL fold metallo-hydrolase n=1 Tax=Mesorhizobium sp. M0145 TaxID=2956895 RepID=UPI0033361CDE
MTLHRRSFPSGAAGLVSSAMLPRPARSAPPHQIQHGDFHVTVLSDGHFALPAEIVAPDATPAEWTEIEARLGGSAGVVEAKCNIPLIQTEKDLFLVDLGGGGKFQPTEGQLKNALSAAGHDPGAVTKVLLTHAHPDHLWGMLGAACKPRFPNATY